MSNNQKINPDTPFVDWATNINSNQTAIDEALSIEDSEYRQSELSYMTYRGGDNYTNIAKFVHDIFVDETKSNLIAITSAVEGVITPGILQLTRWGIIDNNVKDLDFTSQSTTKSYDLSSSTNFPIVQFPNAIFRHFKMSPDGKTMIVFDTEGGNIVQLSLSTAFDVLTLTYVGGITVVKTGPTLTGFDISSDGKHLIYVNRALHGDLIYQLDLPNAWNIVSGTFPLTFGNRVISPIASGAFITSINYSKNGRNIVLDYNASAYVLQITLSTPFDLQTMRNDQEDDIVYQHAWPYLDSSTSTIKSYRYFNNFKNGILAHSNGELTIFSYKIDYEGTTSEFHNGNISKYNGSSIIRINSQGPETQIVEITTSSNTIYMDNMTPGKTTTVIVKNNKFGSFAQLFVGGYSIDDRPIGLGSFTNYLNNSSVILFVGETAKIEVTKVYGNEFNYPASKLIVSILKEI